MFSLRFPKAYNMGYFPVLGTNSLSILTVNRIEPENKLYRELKVTFGKKIM